MWKCYNCDDIRDHGWGCTWRSIQNVQIHLERQVSEMLDIRDSLGEPWGQWLEPADAQRLLGGELLIWGRPASQKPVDDYERVDNLIDLSITIQESKACIIDDGVYAYAVVDGRRLLDPHTVNPLNVERLLDMRMLGRRAGWMVLIVQ